MEDRTFHSFVAGGEPIPPGATAIHGLTDRDIAEAPAFADIYEDLKRFIGPRVVIGHTLGFDLAVLRRECERAGVAPEPWPTLDVGLLAEIVAPALASFSLDAVAAWLGITAEERHRAVGDARITAAVFIALVPKLRASSVRTFGEAARACRRLAPTLDGHRRAGWIEPTTDLPEAGRHEVERRLDSYPYRHRVRDVMTDPPLFARAGESMREALARMVHGRISSVLIGSPEAAASAGIVTERDVLRAIHERGPATLDAPVETLATRPLITISAEAFVYRAIGRMRRFNLRHLAAVAEDGCIVGVLSARDLLRLRVDAAILLGDNIDAAADVAALARAWAKVPAMAAGLLGEEVGARDIAGIIAREVGALTRRAGEMAEARLAAGGIGRAPCAYALLVLGSAGRGESLLALDQDHAVVSEHGKPNSSEDHWFSEFGKHLSDILHEVGVPYCKGGVMSANSEFRGSMRTWRERVTRWIERAGPSRPPQRRYFFSIFARCMGTVYLRAPYGKKLGQRRAPSPRFLSSWRRQARFRGSPFGVFGRLRRENGRIDLKRYGLLPVVATARLLALRHGISVRGTAERLHGVGALDLGGAADLKAALDIHERILDLILRAQLADIDSGHPPSNLVPMTIVEQRGGTGALKADLRVVRSLYDLVRDHLS